MALSLTLTPGQTPLDPDEAAQLIPAHLATQRDLDEWEQTNILRARQWLFRAQRPDVLTEDFCRELHRRMFGQTWRWAGQFRQSDKNMGCAWPQVAGRLRQLLDNTRYQLEADPTAQDEIGIRFHHQLVLVHPFPNGNGRHARMMTDALMRQHLAPLFTWGRQNLVPMGEARRQYIDALRAADAGDLAPLRAFARS